MYYIIQGILLRGIIYFSTSARDTACTLNILYIDDGLKRRRAVELDANSLGMRHEQNDAFFPPPLPLSGIETLQGFQ